MCIRDSIYAIPEGTIIFPREPLLKVIAPVMEAQLIETAILNILNHQSLIATKASRVVYAAKGDGIMEFGLRRAQGPVSYTHLQNRNPHRYPAWTLAPDSKNVQIANHI